jgi:hypothetical protein
MSTTIGTTTLTGFSNTENSRKWELAGHTISKPGIVIQKRNNFDNTNLNAQMTSSLKVVQGTVDASGLPMQPKISLECASRVPVGALDGDIDTAIAAYRDFVASTKFLDLVKAQSYIAAAD